MKYVLIAYMVVNGQDAFTVLDYDLTLEDCARAVATYRLDEQLVCEPQYGVTQ